MQGLEEVEIECGPIRVDDCIGKKKSLFHGLVGISLEMHE